MKQHKKCTINNIKNGINPYIKYVRNVCINSSLFYESMVFVAFTLFTFMISGTFYHYLIKQPGMCMEVGFYLTVVVFYGTILKFIQLTINKICELGQIDN